MCRVAVHSGLRARRSVAAGRRCGGRSLLRSSCPVGCSALWPFGARGVGRSSVPAPASRTLACAVRGWNRHRGGISMIAAEFVDFVSPRVVRELPLFAVAAGHLELSGGPLRRGVQRVSSFGCPGIFVHRVASVSCGFRATGFRARATSGFALGTSQLATISSGVAVTSSASSASHWFVSGFCRWRVAICGRLRSSAGRNSQTASVVVGLIPGVLASIGQVQALRSRRVKEVCR